MLKHRRRNGFTLMEVLITVAIVGILGAVAYPSYSNYVIKSKRAEPQKELLQLANLMEQYYIDQRTYTDDLSDLGKSGATYLTESGNYTMSASIDATGETFTLTASIKSGSSQASDSECASMSINHTGSKTATNATCWEK